MIGRIRAVRPSYAGVTATLALVLALGMGGAYAASKIGSKQIAPSAVKSKHIKNGQVKTPDLSAGAVTSTAIADDSISGAKIASETVGGNDIATAAVGSTELTDNSVASYDLSPDSVGSSELAVTVRTNSVTVQNNQAANVRAECQADEVVLAGGGGFPSGASGTSLANSQVAAGDWLVGGKNTSGSPATLAVQAYCLRL